MAEDIRYGEIGPEIELIIYGSTPHWFPPKTMD
jgi:hypothetical protein